MVLSILAQVIASFALHLARRTKTDVQSRIHQLPAQLRPFAVQPLAFCYGHSVCSLR